MLRKISFAILLVTPVFHSSSIKAGVVSDTIDKVSGTTIAYVGKLKSKTIPEKTPDDLNQNGIRDDVDGLIQKNIFNKNQILAVEQYARAFQALTNSSEISKIQFKSVAQNYIDAKVCVENRFSGSFNLSSNTVFNMVAAKTNNTPERAATYNKGIERLEMIRIVPAHALQACDL